MDFSGLRARMRPFTITDQTGNNPQTVNGFLRKRAPLETVGSADQDETIWITFKSDLVAAGYYPLTRYTRVKDGAKTYSVMWDREPWSDSNEQVVKARMSG